jgi:hypothetical protein
MSIREEKRSSTGILISMGEKVGFPSHGPFILNLLDRSSQALQRKPASGPVIDLSVTVT